MPALQIQREYEEVTEVRTAEELRAHLVRFAERRDFELCGLTAVVDHPGAESEFFAVHNTPKAYLRAYDDSANWKVDPVAQHCKHNSVPIVWSKETYTSAGVCDAWERQAPFGYKTGVALGLHLPRGRHLFVGINRDRALPAGRRALSRIVADLQLFAACAADVAMNVLAPEAVADSKSLAPREAQCLSWTMEGKTAWEVGAILDLAETTVISYLRSAMSKLGCTSKHQAVVRALRLGLIR